MNCTHYVRIVEHIITLSVSCIICISRNALREDFDIVPHVLVWYNIQPAFHPTQHFPLTPHIRLQYFTFLVIQLAQRVCYYVLLVFFCIFSVVSFLAFQQWTDLLNIFRTDIPVEGLKMRTYYIYLLYCFSSVCPSVCLLHCSAISERVGACFWNRTDCIWPVLHWIPSQISAYFSP